MNRIQALEASLNGEVVRDDGSARNVAQSVYVTFPNGKFCFARVYDEQNPNAQWIPTLPRGANIVAVVVR